MKKHSFQDLLQHVYAGFTGVVTLWIYIKTLAPTVSFFDSGELIAAAYTVGVAHPPGYPLYVLIGSLFARLPFGTVASRMNLMSACFAALAAVMAYYITYLLLTWTAASTASTETAPGTPDPHRMIAPVISLAAALLFAFSLTHWQHAVITEVYPLNAFLCGLILFLLFAWRHKVTTSDTPPLQPAAHNEPETQHADAPPAFRHVRLLYLTALLFGLGFGNHQTIILLALAACFLVLVTYPKLYLNRRALIIVGCLALGLCIYLLLPLLALRNPAINWGNPVTWENFKWLVLREGYDNVPRGDALSALWHTLLNDTESFSPASLYHTVVDSLFFQQLRSFHPLREFGYTGTALALLGLLYGLIARRLETLTLLIGLLTLVIVVILIGDPQEENLFLLKEFHTPAYLILAVWIGLGMGAIAQIFLRLATFSRNLQYGLVFLLALAFLAPAAAQMLKNVRAVDRRRNYVAYDYAHNVLTTLAPNAILFTWGDSGAFPLWYLQIVEQVRPDVTLIHTPHLSTKWYVDLLPPELFSQPNPFDAMQGDVFGLIHDIVQQQARSRPIYFDYSCSHSVPIPYELLPHGITYKILMEGDTLDETVWDQYRFRGILDDTRIARDPDIERTFLMYGSAQIELGNFYLAFNELEKAAAAFNRAVEFAPELGDGIARALHFQDKIIGSGLSSSTNPILPDPSSLPAPSP